MKIPRINPEITIAVAAFIISGMVTWHVFTIGMMTALVDQNSHLNLSRQFFDSMTPGISQIGFWPPLLHVLMAPVAAFDPLYQSGLAGYVVLAPAFVVAAIFLYRICLKLTKNHAMSMLGAFIFIVNPFILYYTTTAMMEVLYLAFLFASTYFYLKWTDDEKLGTLIITGICISLTTLARFEGLFLVPISIVLVVLHSYRKKKTYHEIEALGIIYGIVGIVGILFIFIYGYIYGGNAMSFAGSQWSAFNQQRDYLLPTEHNLINSFIYLVHASYHVLGKPMVLLSFVCMILIAGVALFRPAILKSFGSHARLRIFSALALLGSPFLFDIIALFRGNAIIYVPELLPFGVFFNERYGLYWMGLMIVAIILVLSILQAEAKKIHYGYGFNLFLISFILSFILIWNASWLIEEVYENNYRLVKDSAQGYPSHDQAEVASYLRKHYDWGKIFMTRALHDFIAVEAHVALHNYVHESNYKYFDQVMERPWLFARWVVMYNPSSGINGNWAKFNEKISGRYGKSEEFKKYYTLVVENDRERLYKIKPEAVIAYAASKNISIRTIPSLNPELQKWNPDIVYQSMKQSHFNITEVSKNLMTPELLVSSQFLSYYTSQLQPVFANGYVAGRESSSTFQSYALLEAYFAHDQKSFDRIWVFTRKHLQHVDDNLFSSVFSVDKKSGEVQIQSVVSSVGADTDIAYALLKAGQTWKNPSYIREADFIISEIWDQHIASVEGKLVLSSKKVTPSARTIDIKTSAIAPYAYEEFSRYDKTHNWKKLAADSYILINRLSSHEVHSGTSIFLPVEGAYLTKSNNKLEMPEENYYSTNFTSDAYQVYWRVGLDAVLNKNKTAQNYIYVTNIFDEEWKKGRACSIVRYSKDGYKCSYDLSSLSAPLAVWTVKDQKKAEELVTKYYLKNRDFAISPKASFSEKSLFWFGLALWSGTVK